MYAARMYDRRERTSSRRWVAWMPLLFVAAFLYWSVALGLGGISLMAASAVSGELGPASDDVSPAVTEPVPGHEGAGEPDYPIAPIVVRLEESTEPEDVNDNAGAATPTDTVEDDAIVPQVSN